MHVDNMDNKDVLFFDGSCPLCSKEIRFLKRHSQGKQLGFIDIHQLTIDDQNQNMPNKTELLRVLHLRRQDQSWLTGVDATVHAWSHLPLGGLLKVLRWPLIKPVVDNVYTKWADRRYQKRYQCGPCMGAEE